MRVLFHVRLRTLALAIVVLLVTAGVAASATAKDVLPFTYSFRITAVAVTGSWTVGDATTTTRAHLREPSAVGHMTWLGRHDGGMHNGSGGVSVSFAGDATYGSTSVPTCARTLKLDSSSPVFLSLGGGRDPVVRHPTIVVSIQNFPFVIGNATRDGLCGKVEKSAESATKILPYSVLAKKSFTVVAEQHQVLEDGEGLDWTLKLTLKRIAFRSISCAAAKGC